VVFHAKKELLYFNTASGIEASYQSMLARLPHQEANLASIDCQKSASRLSFEAQD
jgi:hypothetical protein